MRLVISVIALSGLFLITILLVRRSSKDQGISYTRYKEQHTYNLKNPIIKHYRELSCEPTTEIATQEDNQKDKQ